MCTCTKKMSSTLIESEVNNYPGAYKKQIFILKYLNKFGHQVRMDIFVSWSLQSASHHIFSRFQLHQPGRQVMAFIIPG